MAKRKIQTRGDTIRALRLRADLNQKELAKKAGVGLRTLQAMEKGIGAEAFFIDCVATALGKSRSDLFQPLEREKGRPLEPVLGERLTPENQWIYGFNTVSAACHARFADTPETPEAVKELLSAVSLLLDKYHAGLVEFRYMRHTGSLDIGVKLPAEHLYALVQKLIAGELDRIPLQPPGVALIDQIRIPADTLSDDASKGASVGNLEVGIWKLALRSHLEKLAKELRVGATIVTFQADGSAVVDRDLMRRLIQQHGATTEGLRRPSDFDGYSTIESRPPVSRPDDLSLDPTLLEKSPHPKKKNWWDISPPKSDPSSSIRRGTKLRILVADSNLRAAKSLATNLRKMGHEVQTASDGLEAVQAAADFHPQIVLLSIDLPRMGGYQTMKLIRSQTSKERIVFIAMTTRSQERQRQEALGYGFDRWLITPVKPAAFEQLVELLHD